MSDLAKYAVEIYSPGNRGSDVACRIDSDTPFLPFNVGDLINAKVLPTHAASALEGAVGNRKHGIVLRVTGVEHFVIERDGVLRQHKVGVFTESLDDLEWSRPG